MAPLPSHAPLAHTNRKIRTLAYSLLQEILLTNLELLHKLLAIQEPFPTHREERIVNLRPQVILFLKEGHPRRHRAQKVSSNLMGDRALAIRLCRSPCSRKARFRRQAVVQATFNQKKAKRNASRRPGNFVPSSGSTPQSPCQPGSFQSSHLLRFVNHLIRAISWRRQVLLSR